MVVYLDTRPGGFEDTASLYDNADVYRAAASGVSVSRPYGGDLFFAPGMRADFALVYDGANLVCLELGYPEHVLRAECDVATGPAAVEGVVPRAAMELAPGGELRYVATLGDAYWLGFFRSDEFHGVSQSTVPPGNPGLDQVWLSPGDFNTFTLYNPPTAARGAAWSQLKALFAR
jgi:hypothetical protein